jgi:hypothetical protein
METSPIAPLRSPRVSIPGTFSHPSTNVEQTVVTVTASQFGGSGLALVEVDCTALTKNSNICRILGAFSGVTFTPMPGRAQTASMSQIFTFEFRTTVDFRVGLTSGTAEGATRSIPYKISIY